MSTFRLQIVTPDQLFMDEEVEAFTALMRGAHSREAMTAFFEKRKPVFD